MQATSLATSKSRQTTSEDAWALFISRCRYADNEYSNQFNISFAIVDIKCVQIYNKFEAKGLQSLKECFLSDCPVHIGHMVFGT